MRQIYSERFDRNQAILCGQEIDPVIMCWLGTNERLGKFGNKKHLLIFKSSFHRLLRCTTFNELHPYRTCPIMPLHCFLSFVEMFRFNLPITLKHFYAIHLHEYSGSLNCCFPSLYTAYLQYILGLFFIHYVSVNF